MAVSVVGRAAPLAYPARGPPLWAPAVDGRPALGVPCRPAPARRAPRGGGSHPPPPPALGLPGPSPAAISAAAVPFKCSMAMSKTRVTPLRARAAQLIVLRRSAGEACPATTRVAGRRVLVVGGGAVA